MRMRSPRVHCPLPAGHGLLHLLHGGLAATQPRRARRVRHGPVRARPMLRLEAHRPTWCIPGHRDSGCRWPSKVAACRLQRLVVLRQWVRSPLAAPALRNQSPPQWHSLAASTLAVRCLRRLAMLHPRAPLAGPAPHMGQPPLCRQALVASPGAQSASSPRLAQQRLGLERLLLPPAQSAGAAAGRPLMQGPRRAARPLRHLWHAQEATPSRGLLADRHRWAPTPRLQTRQLPSGTGSST